jgi:predicted nucleic acid-binding protein
MDAQTHLDDVFKASSPEEKLRERLETIINYDAPVGMENEILKEKIKLLRELIEKRKIDICLRANGKLYTLKKIEWLKKETIDKLLRIALETWGSKKIPTYSLKKI